MSCISAVKLAQPEHGVKKALPNGAVHPMHACMHECSQVYHSYVFIQKKNKNLNDVLQLRRMKDDG
ncbi:hypothetical protein COS86_03090 [Candidatus Bathyarchaeota archaeon CG07_land_8_20_14_0_80_47_9]|nr:MAG: hypothetical protein COS86_03090 [Candidatus Bathyarchaeota archaeon CG07_land_8_20_14_0_80_47_9]